MRDAVEPGVTDKQFQHDDPITRCDDLGLNNRSRIGWRRRAEQSLADVRYTARVGLESAVVAGRRWSLSGSRVCAVVGASAAAVWAWVEAGRIGFCGGVVRAVGVAVELLRVGALQERIQRD